MSSLPLNSFVLALSGSPSAASRSSALASLALAAWGHDAPRQQLLSLRDLPAADLLHARTDSSPIAEAVARVREAQVVLVATPIYKAAYSGLLKTFLDLLPQDALAGKTVLPLATGGSTAHLLAVDYALRPVLAALGARHILDSVYATDSQLPREADGSYLPDPELLQRVQRALHPLRSSSPAGALQAVAGRCRPQMLTSAA